MKQRAFTVYVLKIKAALKLSKKNPQLDWKEYHISGDIPAVRQQVVAAQDKVCVSCERPISCAADARANDRAPIEHIKPRSKYPNLTFEQRNLAASCDRINSCGRAKGDTIIAVEPGPECNVGLTMLDSGRLAAEEGSMLAETIATLGLNQSEQVGYRVRLINTVRSLAAEGIQPEEILDAMAPQGRPHYLRLYLQDLPRNN